MSEEGRVGVLMCAGCAFVCLLLFVTVSLTQVAMQDRRLVSCADALAGAGVGGASASSVIARQESGIDEAGARSRVEVALVVARRELAGNGRHLILRELQPLGSWRAVIVPVQTWV